MYQPRPTFSLKKTNARYSGGGEQTVQLCTAFCYLLIWFREGILSPCYLPEESLRRRYQFGTIFRINKSGTGMIGLLFGILAVLLSILTVFIYHRSQYWKRRGVPSIGNVFWGDFKKNFLLQQNIGETIGEHYSKYKHLKFTGSFILGRPTLFIHDPELIKEVITKNADIFGGRGFYYDAEKDPLSANLFFIEGTDWKNMRFKLTPAFTSAKTKYMFSTVLECISKLEVQIEKERGNNEYVTIDSRDLMARLSTDVILSVTLGIIANSVENPETNFRRIGKLMFDPSFSQFLKITLFASMHSVIRFCNWKLAPKETNDFFIKAVRDTVAYREANKVTRKDFLDLMIKLKNHGHLRDSTDDPVENDEKTSAGNYLSVDEIAAQAFFFYIAGFETTSATLSFSLYEIAKHPEVQHKIQAECDAAMTSCGGNINYETVQSLQYTEMVVNESQRLHPPAAILSRSTLTDCNLPGTDIKLEKNTPITISLAGLNRDPDFYPDPDRFDPERFSAKNKERIPQHIFMPFGEGPRYCIGKRFAIIQVKATLLTLLSKYDVELAEGTPRTMEYEPRNLLPAPKFPLILKFIPRKN